MKKFVALIAVISLSLFVWGETVFTFVAADDMNQTKDGITVIIAQGSGQTAPTLTTDYQTGSPEMRLYVGNTISVSANVAITNIQMVFAKSSASNKQYTGLSASTGELVSGGESADKNDWKVDRWTGSANNVVFTLTEKGQRRIQKIVVGGDSITVTPIEDTLPTEEDLDASYIYAEPTEINVPDTTIWKAEYAFIDQNILVHCSQGSIVKATDTTFAYFNCNAEYTLTFTATEAIKGIKIDGFVRKAFSANCDHGEIEYLTDIDFDMEGWPAMVIRNIDATSVTLSCPKQLRCYGVRVYFQENPNHLDIDKVNTTRQATKILHEGQLFIIHNGRTFTAIGTEIR